MFGIAAVDDKILFACIIVKISKVRSLARQNREVRESLEGSVSCKTKSRGSTTMDSQNSRRFGLLQDKIEKFDIEEAMKIDPTGTVNINNRMT